MTERSNLNVGLLPLRIEMQNTDIPSVIGLGHKITALLNKLLEETQKFNVIQLAWPHAVETGKIDTSGYNQLLKTAKKEQTNVLLITALPSLIFQIWRLPAYFGILFRFINFIRIKVTIEVAVLDIRQQKVIANLKEGGDKYTFFYKGAEVNGLSNLDQIREEDFSTTLTGKASTEALEKIASQLVNIGEKISEVSSIGTNVPKGLHFSRNRYLFKIDRNFDQWAEVEVINNDDKTHRFIVKTERDYEDVAIGFIGRGSADSICELEAGDIKRVRLVVMAAQAQNAVYNVPVHLYSMDGKSSVDISPAPLDKADIVIEILRPELNIAVKKVSEDPFTLTQTYEITNNGTQVTDLSIYPAEDFKGSILFFPIIDKLLLNAGASVQFSVAPVLHKDFRNVNGDVVITGNGLKKLIPVSFSLPTGKKLFEVDVGSRGMYSSSTTYCTNIGGGETRIGAPPSPPDDNCGGLKPLTPLSQDEATQKMESKKWDTLDNLHPKLKEALMEFKKLVENKRGVFKIDSGYRTKSYQNHLWEVWKNCKILRSNPQLRNRDECKGLIEEIDRECHYHFGEKLPPKVARPGNSKHEKNPSEAADVTISGIPGNVKNKIVEEFKHLYPEIETPVSGEPWHYQLKGVK